jgi:hypothetical protein
LAIGPWPLTGNGHGHGLDRHIIHQIQKCTTRQILLCTVHCASLL